MKKILLIILILMVGLVGCQPVDSDQPSILTIYTLNDYHGNVFSEDGTLSQIGNYLMSAKAANPDTTLLLSSGDMWQGTAISNMTQGAVIVEAMNAIGFDAMTIGNHEFDWGIEVIESYQNQEGLDANFPLIAANIYEKASDEPVSWAQPYAIIERGSIKVGVIGIIGVGLESSISPSIVAPYVFKEEIPIVTALTKQLRTEMNVDVVILSVHGNSTNRLKQYADLAGDYQIDAIIDGHTHSRYAGEQLGSDNIRMPYVQAGSNGSHIGRIVLQLNENKRVTGGSANLIQVRPTLAQPSPILDEIINRYHDVVKEISDEVIGISGTDISRLMGTAWAADVIWLSSQTEIGIINTGGIRASGFPILPNEEITVGHIWQIMPFDNVVKTVEMKVKDILDVNSKTSLQFSSNVIISGNTMYVGGVAKTSEDYIHVATIDYLFDNTNYKFLEGRNPVHTGILFRDMLIDEVRDYCKDGARWYAQVQLP